MAAAASPVGAIWRLHCDGSALPNPGRMGCGAVIEAPDGTRELLSLAPPSTGCNNEAELRALMAALAHVRACGGRQVIACTDSRTVVDQLASTDASLPIARLAPLFDDARTLLRAFDSAELRWIPGHRNAEADALARAALGMPPRLAAKPTKKRR